MEGSAFSCLLLRHMERMCAHDRCLGEREREAKKGEKTGEGERWKESVCEIKRKRVCVREK